MDHRSLWRRLCCFFGWHEWAWKFESGSTLVLNAPPPSHAKCSRCGTPYGGKSEKHAAGVKFCNDLPQDAVGFSYVDVTSPNCEGWLNLFWGDYCVALVNNAYIAEQMRQTIPQLVFNNQKEKP